MSVPNRKRRRRPRDLVLLVELIHQHVFVHKSQYWKAYGLAQNYRME